MVLIEEYTEMQERLGAKLSGNSGNGVPSAPPEEGAPSAPSSLVEAPLEPSAPIETFQSSECCVCMERKVQFFFISGNGSFLILILK